jgi:hypothetical protein
MMYMIFFYSPHPVMKLFALISLWTKPLRCICSRRVIICIPMARVVVSEKPLELSGVCATRFGRDLRVRVRIVR